MQDETLEELYLPFLRNTRTRIDTPEKWCRGAMARNVDGIPVGTAHPEVCQFCVSGSVEAEFGGRQFPFTLRYVLRRDFRKHFCEVARTRRLPHHGYGECPSDYNDHGGNTHADILRVLDTMIAETEAHL